MVFTRPLISKSFNPFINLLETVPSAPITIGITVNFMLYWVFFSSLERSRFLSFFLFSFSYTLWSARTAKSTIRQVLIYSFIYLFILFYWGWGDYHKVRLFGRDLVRSLCFSFSRTVSGLCIYIFVRLDKFKHLAQFLVDHFPHPVVSSRILFLC